MVDAFFPGYAKRLVSIGEQRIGVHVGGTGPALLLLHGYPQNHAAWIKLAAPLARRFTCVIADLPGYGASSIPADTPSHDTFSKRHMAALLVSTMASIGHKEFSVMGHDRGARVAYRMALDHPASIRSVVIVEIIPTSDMWDAFDAGMAMKGLSLVLPGAALPLAGNADCFRSGLLSRLDAAELDQGEEP